MIDDNELDAVARLRAADPAHDVVPRAGFADEVVARSAGVGQPAEPWVVADLRAERTRRRPRWLPVAAVAASIAIVGAAGFGIGASTGGPSNSAGGPAAPPISMRTGGNPDGLAENGSGAAGGADQKMADSTYRYGYGRNSFSATGLGTHEGTARGYTFDARAASNAETVAAFATALGITAPVELKDGAWVAGQQDGSSPTVSVSLDGVLSFNYQDPRINPWQCGDDTSDGTEPDGADSDGAEKCGPTGTPPGEAAAIDVLRTLIAAAGKDPAAFELTSQVWGGSVTRYAEARPVIDGQSVDQVWSLELAEAGIVYANGALADIVGLGGYPVVSEQEGFERLSDPRFGATTMLPFALRAEAADASLSAPEEWVPPTEPPGTPSAGARLSWPVNDVRIVDARLGLASHWQQDGSVLVVPAYEFTDANGDTWSVIAVAEPMLDFAAQ